MPEIRPSVKPLTALRTVYFAMMMGMVLFSAVIYVVNAGSDAMHPLPKTQQPFLYGLPFIAA
ncbi:MAG TPA: hypothetical protein VF145_06125, partial [Chitinophagaceae bacterium]